MWRNKNLLIFTPLKGSLACCQAPASFVSRACQAFMGHCGHALPNIFFTIMLTLIRTNSENKDFITLVRLLDGDLELRNGADYAFFAQFNKIDLIRHVIVAYANGQPAGCGAVKLYADDTGEIKRMFVRAEYRRQGIAGSILLALESWARELNFGNLILETGKAQLEAIRLYTKSGYGIIPNYGQYENVESSVCMKKEVAPFLPGKN